MNISFLCVIFKLFTFTFLTLLTPGMAKICCPSTSQDKLLLFPPERKISSKIQLKFFVGLKFFYSDLFLSFDSKLKSRPCQPLGNLTLLKEPEIAFLPNLTSPSHPPNPKYHHLTPFDRRLEATSETTFPASKASTCAAANEARAFSSWESWTLLKMHENNHLLVKVEGKSQGGEKKKGVQPGWHLASAPPGHHLLLWATLLIFLCFEF